MCFSATASFSAAAVISTVGMFAFTKARTHSMRLFATTPIFFGIQQALEGIVWVTLMNGDSTSFLHHVGVYGFLFFVGIFWPIWVSGCLYLLESVDRRKKLLLITFVIGIITACNLFYIFMLQDQTAQIINHHISYPILAATYSEGPVYILLTVVYLLSVVAPFFISSIRYMWIIGAVVAIAFVIAQIFYALAFGSVWCFFGALATVVTYKIASS